MNPYLWTLHMWPDKPWTFYVHGLNERDESTHNLVPETLDNLGLPQAQVQALADNCLGCCELDGTAPAPIRYQHLTRYVQWPGRDAGYMEWTTETLGTFPNKCAAIEHMDTLDQAAIALLDQAALLRIENNV